MYQNELLKTIEKGAKETWTLLSLSIRGIISLIEASCQTKSQAISIHGKIQAFVRFWLKINRLEAILVVFVLKTLFPL